MTGCLKCLLREAEELIGNEAVNCKKHGEIAISENGCPDFRPDIGAVWRKNLEHEGIEIEFESKPAQSIIDKLKAAGFKWSRRQGIWYSKNRAYPLSVAEEIARYDGTTGEPLSVAEREALIDERAAARAERFGELAAKNAGKAEAKFEQARRMGDAIPLGQPILVGHHSEGADRRYRGRIQNTFMKARETQEKADYYGERAEASARKLRERKDPGVITRRIDKMKADLRKHHRNLEDCLFSPRFRPISRDSALYYSGHIERLGEEIAYWQAELEAQGAKVWGPEDFKAGEVILTRFGKATIEKVNKATLKLKYHKPEGDFIHLSTLTKYPYNELPQNCKVEA